VSHQVLVATTDLHQVIYVSAAKSPQSDADLLSLLNASRTRNAASALTGLLLYDQGCFLQVLEGSRDAVAVTYTRIERDPRHHRISKIFDAHVSARSFDKWAMGFSTATPELLRDVPGFSDFFRAVGQSLSPDASFALRLVEGFRQGRWHA